MLPCLAETAHRVSVMRDGDEAAAPTERSADYDCCSPETDVKTSRFLENNLTVAERKAGGLFFILICAELVVKPLMKTW